jgi:hypothetical protein
MNKVVYYELQFCLVDAWSPVAYFSNAPYQFFQEGKLGKPKEEIGNLNGYEFMELLSDLKVPYLFNSSSISINIISMGKTESENYGE